MAFYFSRENYRNIVRGSTLSGSGVISTVNTGLTAQNDNEIDRGIDGPLTGLTPPTILSFTSNKISVTAGDPVTLSWTTANTDQVILNFDIGDVSANGVSFGNYTVDRVEQPSTFQLTAVNQTGTDVKFRSISIIGQAPLINSFTANPTNIVSGSGSTLSWSTTNASSVSINGIGSVNANGIGNGSYRVTSITQSTQYTLTATNPYGTATQTANVSVTPASNAAPTIDFFFADPNNTLGTGLTTLRWGIRNNPTTITITPVSLVGSVSPNQTSINVSGINQNTQFRITAINSFGQASKTTNVVFGSGEAGNAGASFAVDFPRTNSIVSFQEMKNLARERLAIWYNFDGAVSTVNTGSRANGSYADDPQFTWFRWINGNYKGNSGQFIFDAAGNTIDQYGTIASTSLKNWYTWGARRFHISSPFGKPIGTPESGAIEGGAYQPDAYVCARDGLYVSGVTYNTIGFVSGVTLNEPMPWVVNDFVKTFKALITGTQGNLTNNEWNILTGATGWFDPSDPIKLSFYNGAINQENYVRFKQLGTTQAIFNRLVDSFTPFLEIGNGVRIGLDALTRAPGATPGINVTSAIHNWAVANSNLTLSPFGPKNFLANGETFGVSDAGWWNFYNNWLIPNFGKQNIYCEGAPEAYRTGSGTSAVWRNNPYFGHPYISDDDGFYQSYGNEPGTREGTALSVYPVRSHQPSEMGNVEGILSHFQSIRKYPNVGVSGSSGFTYGRYWFLRDYAIPSYGSNEDGSTFPEVTIAGVHDELAGPGARIYRAVEAPGQGSMAWEWAWYTERLLNKPRVKHDNANLDNTIRAVHLPHNTLYDPDFQTEGEEGSWVNPGFEDFKDLFLNVDEYANYLAYLKNGGTPIPRGFSADVGLRYNYPQIIPNLDEISDHTKLMALGLVNHGIDGAMVVGMSDIDHYCQTKLNGVSGGQLYRPSITADIEQRRFKSFLNQRIERAKEVSGSYPKHLIFSLTKNDGSTNPSQFQMERYLYTPNTTPNSSDYTQYSTSTKSPCYDNAVPTVFEDTGDPQQEDKLVSSGYGITHQDYLLTINLVSKILELAAQWKIENQHNISIGVENLSDTSLEPRTSYTITGGGTGVTVAFKNTWGATQWNRPSEFGGFTTLSEQETIESKAKLRLEYIKRVEPLVDRVETLYPNVYDYHTLTDSNDEKYNSYHREKMDMAHLMKTGPVSFGGNIYSIMSYGHVGSLEGPTFNDLDPKTTNGGSTIDYADINEDSIDWVRTDYHDITTLKVKGQAVWTNLDYASRAMEITAYTGITANRQKVYKWLVAFGGTGATIDWGNTLDVLNKMKDFYSGHQNAIKRVCYRFGGETLEEPQTQTGKLKILQQGLYHPTNGNGIVQTVSETGKTYDNLEVHGAKILYLNNAMGIEARVHFDLKDIGVTGSSVVPDYTVGEVVFANGATPGSATDAGTVRFWSLASKLLVVKPSKGGWTSGGITGDSSGAGYVLNTSNYAKGNGKYFFNSWGTSGRGIGTEPFTNFISGNTLTGAIVNQFAYTGTTADYRRAATTLFEQRFKNLFQTYDGEILKLRPDDLPPSATFDGYILPDPELIRYPQVGSFQNANEQPLIEACKLVNGIVYDACKLAWPNAKIGYWGECQADSEPFNDYNTRWDDFFSNPALGAGFTGISGESLTDSGVTGWINYVAPKLKYIYEDTCDFVVPNFYAPYQGETWENADNVDVHYRHISSFWNSPSGDKVVNSRTKTYADVTLRLIKRMNELLVADDKARKEVYPTIWNLQLTSNQFGNFSPDSVYQCGEGGPIYGITSDRSQSYFSNRKFIEQNLGVSGSTFNFRNLSRFPLPVQCDSGNEVRRLHPELFDASIDFYYPRYIKNSLESGIVDGFYNWNIATNYDTTYAARSKQELIGTASGQQNLLNIGDTPGFKNEVAVLAIYLRRFMLHNILGLTMTGITFGGYFENPNGFSGASALGFSFDTWGQYNNIGHPASKFTRHKYMDYLLKNFCGEFANRAINDGLI